MHYAFLIMHYALNHAFFYSRSAHPLLWRGLGRSHYSAILSVLSLMVHILRYLECQALSRFTTEKAQHLNNERRF